MKVLKKIILVLTVMIISIFLNSISSEATTVTITTDALNLREKASTSSNILMLLSKGEECELIGEQGEWYKIKYKTYIGYISKEYAEKSAEEVIDKNSEIQNQDNESLENVTQTTGKTSKSVDIKLLPLIYSSKIDTLKQDTTITIITEFNGWAYIETNTITGWIRSDSIKNRKQISNTIEDTNADDKLTNKTEEDEKTNTDKNNAETNVDLNNDATVTKKTMYVNDSYVNVRKAPNTSSDVIMVLTLNTKLTVIGESGDWYKVSTSEGDLYVSKELLSANKVTSSSRGGITQIVKNSNDNIETTITNTTTSNNTSSSKNSSSGSINSKNNEVATNLKLGEQIVSYAKQFLGVPYVYGGASKSGFDCSGFTMYVYDKFGISMRHGAQAQAKLGTAINADKTSASSLKENLQVGDLVFFLDYETMDEIGHCGIYIGDGNFIHASSGSGYCVKINSLLPGEYYNTRYCAARRII